ncbi:NADHX dehydratase NDAI_0C03850 [Naumovozyma dairenensis CBS 421]|uniref:ATP-dependent (S)-NAD(P)H-hydrate dehydratase n=1 Tax=Naumovozyma dairenensis (strain ATCC 10597 / BCRC 20456 / CBS 421 / NBRC 0211 / NRRL Y-12639) TaxID=1071378 RepID=G0W8D4_NAUDC|nr:hypothetical protein NDAI_0C03850 [Naumovozyma dairenensis CBS 421]CCD24045.1 hypothetical protein NDAI_0C03850 [Naumovozyma dairenensis CBS 421]
MLPKLSHNELIKLISKRCIPPLLPRFYKGQAGGRVCIIGGCEDYTGAPYFSANATALMGCDLTHVICEKDAATVIKSYTPNLMVHPYLRTSKDKHEEEFEKIEMLLKRIHVIVIGPGLGRDKGMLDSIKKIIKLVLEKHEGMIPIVIDADGLFLISQDEEVREMLKKFPMGRIILTPNVVEFKRLSESVGHDPEEKDEEKDISSNEVTGATIAKRLNCIVVQKGREDRIFSPQSDSFVLKNDREGSCKRVGGQGDTLTGTIACMLAFSRSMHDFKLCEDENNGKNKKGHDELKLEWIDFGVLSCYAGCTVTRECSRLAFKEKGRAMQTSDINERVGQVYAKVFPL